MDPNSLSNLDPKLKETYERVMGASTPPATTQAPASVADTTAPIDQHPANNTPSSLPPLPPSVDSLSQSPLTHEQPTATNTQQASPNSNFIKPIGKQPGHGGLIKVFYVLGGAVFFTIYVMFWMKILNVSLPF